MTRAEIEKRADKLLAVWPDAETMHLKLTAALVEMWDAACEECAQVPTEQRDEDIRKEIWAKKIGGLW